MVLPHSHRATNELAVSLLRSAGKLGGDILDLGAGNGYLSVMLKESSEHREGTGRIEACDIDRGSFDVPDVKFRVCDANEGLPYGDAAFDAIVAIEVLEHTRVPYAILVEIHRILKPGGLLIFSVPNVGHLVSRFDFLLNGHYQLYPSPSAVPEKGGHICGHISPLPYQYWHYGLRWAGFGGIELHQDRVKKSAAFLAAVLWPFQKWSTARQLKRLSRDRQLFQETSSITEEANGWYVLTSRSLTFSAKK